jgi:hypothetical protein
MLIFRSFLYQNDPPDLFFRPKPTKIHLITPTTSYTESNFRRDMLPATVPEIQRANLGNVVLLLKSLGISDVRGFGFMDAPPGGTIVNSLLRGVAVGFWWLFNVVVWVWEKGFRMRPE